MRKRINLNKKSVDTIKVCQQEFIKHCRAKNLADRTITTYANGYIMFTKFIDENRLITSITNTTIKEYILYLWQRGMNANSVNVYLRSVRSFLNYCHEEGFIDKVKIQLQKVDETPKETYTDEELQKLLRKPNVKRCTFTEYRNWVIVNILIGTGMRLNTLRNLKVSDVSLDNNTILMSKTKVRRSQHIPMTPTLADVLKEYLELRTDVKSEFLFVNAYGEQMTDNCVKLAIRTYNLDRGVEKTSCHLFRHTYAKHYIMTNGNVFKLQKLLQHHDLEITKRYVNLYCSDLAEGYEEHNLLENTKKQRKRISVN